jgi:hypothetical protein
MRLLFSAITTAVLTMLAPLFLRHEAIREVGNAGPINARQPTTVGQLAVLDARIVCICHPQWHGIRAATYTRGAPVIEIPDMNDPYVARKLLDDFRHVHTLQLIVVEGIVPGSVNFAYRLREELPQSHAGLRIPWHPQQHNP